MREFFVRDWPHDRDEALRRVAAAVAVESSALLSAEIDEHATYLLRHLVTQHGDTWQVDRDVAVTLGSFYLGRSLSAPGQPDTAVAREQGRQLVKSFLYAADPPDLPDWVTARLGEVGLPPREWLGEEELTRERWSGVLALGGFLASGGENLGLADWLMASRDLLEAAYEQLAEGSLDKAVAAGRLGVVLADLGAGSDSDLQRILDLLEQARSRVPAEHVDYAGVVGLLGRLLCQVALARRDLTTLDEAIACLRDAVAAATYLTVRPVLAMTYAALSDALMVRRGAVGQGDADLTIEDEAIDALRRAVDLTAGVPDARRIYLDGLHQALSLVPFPSTELRDEMSDVRCALLELIEPDDDAHPELTLRAAEALASAGRHDEAMALLAGPALGPDADADLRARADVVRGRMTNDRHLDEMTAQMTAILGQDGETQEQGLMQVMLEMLGLGQGDEETRFAQDAGGMVQGFLAGSASPAMDEFITRTVHAVRAGEISPAPTADELELGLSGLPGMVRDPQLRDELKATGRALLDVATPGSMEEVMVRSRLLALDFAERQSSTGQDDLTSKMRFLEEFLPLLGQMQDALRSTYEGMGAGGLVLTVNAGGTAFDKLGLLDRYIAESRTALAHLGPSTEERRACLAHLALALFSRFLGGGRDDEYEEAATHAREALTDVRVPHRELFALYSTWALAAGFRGTGQHPTPAAAKTVASEITDGDAVSALEEIERNASAMLGQDVAMRRDIAAMEAIDPELHREYVEAVRLHREQLATDPYSRFLTSIEEKAQIDAQIRMAKVIQRIRASDELSRFVTEVPLSVDAMRPAARDGAVVAFNLSELRCDAVVLRHEGNPLIVPLPELRVDDLRETAARFRVLAPRAVSAPSLYGKLMRDTLTWLWDRVVGPVLDELGHHPGGAETSLPRVWWMPTGLLHGMPLHAAERFDEVGAAALDRVVSSYTPNVRTLLHGLSLPQAQRPVRLLPVAASRNGQHDDRELQNFLEEVAEVEALLRLGPEQVVRCGATVEGVLEVIDQASLAHFACHAGAVDSGADSLVDSALFLANGELTAREVADRRLSLGELAYLSVCDASALSDGATAMGEVVHIGSAFQAAGFRQTISTMWPLLDQTAREASSAFYANLEPHTAFDAPLPAARVLHEVVQELRRANPKRAESWAGLVHSGA